MQDDCFSNMVQDFLVCTTIHKASQLGIQSKHTETMVRVSIDKMTKSTKSISHCETPCFNEYYIFQFNCTLNELLRKTMSYELRTLGPCNNGVHGELFVDLSHVWTQPSRYLYKKWGRLEEPLHTERKRSNPKPKGYLQIDLAIITEASNTELLLKEVEEQETLEKELNKDYDDIKGNMLTNIDPKVECNTRYTISFFYGIFAKKSDYYIRFKFYPFRGKTKVCKSSNTPAFNEYATFSWAYPSATQTLVLEIMCDEHFNSKCLAEYELHFSEIAFKDKPKLGPTFLHFYDIEHPFQYVGRLLIEIRSECLTERLPPRELAMGNILPSEDNRWWQNEIFNIEFLALQCDFLSTQSNSGKIVMKLGEHTSDELKFHAAQYRTRQKVVKKLKYFQQKAPYKTINILVELPDNRHKYDSDYFIQEVVDYMRSELEAFKLFQIKYTNQFQMQVKCLRSIISSIQLKIKTGVSKKRLEYINYKDPTPWDTNRVVYLQEVMRVFPEQLHRMSQTLQNANSYTVESTIEDIVKQLSIHYKRLLDLLCTTRIQDDWPDLFLLISSSSKEIGMCRINPKIFLNTPMNKELSSINSCWCVRHFVFKDINCPHTCSNCGCFAAIVTGGLGIVAESERNTFLDEIFTDWIQKEKFYYSPTVPYTYFKCRIFIYQAKIRPGFDKKGLCDAFARVIFNGFSTETSPVPSTLAPTWNMVISFESIKLPGLVEWYALHPPLIPIEVYDINKHTANDYLGCGFIVASVISDQYADRNIFEDGITTSYLRKYQRLKTLSPPLMKWIPISVDGIIRAEVLASAELVCTGDQNISIEPIATYGIPTKIRPNMKNFVLEVIFVGFRNYMKSFCGRHCVKIMMGDMVLSSGLTASRMRNVINFLVLHASAVVNLPEQLEYWPSIIATDVLVSGSKETTIGAMILTNSKRYLQQRKFIMCLENTDEVDTPDRTTLFIERNFQPHAVSAQTRKFWNLLKFWFKPSEPKNSCEGQTAKENEFTWWTKFYNSMNKNTPNFNPCKHFLTIFDKELEKHAEFEYLHDWAEPIAMVHGIKYKKNSVPKEEVYATLKLNIKITPCRYETNTYRDNSTLRPLATALNPEYQSKIRALAQPCNVFLRVYIVQGVNFRPRDKSNPSDAYVRVRLGSKSLSNRAHLLTNQTNPVFGKCFELDGLLPRDHLLEITVYDRNFLKESVIGSTVIDVEDRWHTKHRATVGLANEYSTAGYNEWRDVVTPYDLLHDLCKKHHVDAPAFEKARITVDGEIFSDDTEISTGWYNEELQQRLCLTVLKNLEKLPSFRYGLIPEHVETRSLFRANSPGIEQGKLQLWVELYDSNVNIPRPVDISPLKPDDFELRVVVLNCADIACNEKIVFGPKVNDLLVKCWCNDFQKYQQTDIHHRTLNGKGHFNWRMIFEIKYSSIEDMMICKRKAGTCEEYQTKQPPLLFLQVVDNDVRDEFLAAFEINLSNFPEPYQTARECNEVNMELEKGWRPFGASTQIKKFTKFRRKAINLFQERKISGWFPLQGLLRRNGKKLSTEYAGKIELALEMLTAVIAKTDPAGFGREEPNALPAPRRPDMSFDPFRNPGKSCKYIIWPFMRRHGLLLIVVVFVIVCILFVIIHIPNFIMSAFDGEF